MADVTEIDASTGATIFRDFTPEEVAQRQADEAEHAVRKTITDTLDGNRATLTERATQALVGNRDFLALAAPTNAQTLAQVKDLTRQSSAIIRLLLNAVEEVD
jgi:hypothetical protein